MVQLLCMMQPPTQILVHVHVASVEIGNTTLVTFAQTHVILSIQLLKISIDFIASNKMEGDFYIQARAM
jgi:hypothetical protein